MSHFEDPRYFIPNGLFDFIDISRLNGFPVDPAVVSKWPGVLKSVREDFVVTETRPNDYPGIPDALRNDNAFLTVAPTSDMPGLRTDVMENGVLPSNHSGAPAVAMTVVKKGENTWRVIDLIAQHLTQQLGRSIHHSQIQTSGLKDRWAVTAQTVIVVGVTMAEMSRVDWSRFNSLGSGFFVKDMRPTSRRLGKGRHLANHFEIAIRFPDNERTKDQIESYMAPRMMAMSMNDYLIPNAFHRQRLGPGQNLQLKGRTLIAGDFQPPAGVYPFVSNTEALLYRMLFESAQKDRDQVRELRRAIEPFWQFDFEQLARTLGSQFRRYNLTLEYEIARRLADNDGFSGCSEAILYDLRDRLSLCIGAWQAFYWNQELMFRYQKGWLNDGRNVHIPLPMSCEDAKRVYRRTPMGQQCLAELAKTEALAAPAEPYLAAFIDDYWSRNAPSRQNHPDPTGLSLALVTELFCSCKSIAGLERPEHNQLSAALVKHMFLVPRDQFSGQVKEVGPRRPAFVRANGFGYTCEDGVLRLRFSLRSGAYATMVVGCVVDTSDPEEADPTNSESSDE